jgi:thymidylate synthase
MTSERINSKFIYQPCCNQNQLICDRGQTAIITGWTVKEAIAKHLSDGEFAVIGNLYSPTRGISPLIRNLLANPHVRFLVVLNATKEDNNSGSCECLLDFFRHGFTQGKSDLGRECWVINSPIRGYIDLEIERESLGKLRKSIQWQEVFSIEETINLVKFYSQKEPLEPWGEPLFFPEEKSNPTVFPGDRYGHRIEGKTIAQTWVKILHRIKTTGTIRPSQYGQWQELIDLVAIVTEEPPDFYFPDPNYLPIEREFIDDYRSQMLDDAIPCEGVKYTYGQRLRSWFGCDQIEQAIQKLIATKDSSRVVMSLWDVQKDNNNDSPPCLNHIWLRIVDNELSLTATFRSNDMFSAWPANAMGLIALQQYICDSINEGRSCKADGRRREKDERIKERSQETAEGGIRVEGKKEEYLDSQLKTNLLPSAHLRKPLRVYCPLPSSKCINLKRGPLVTISQSAHIYDDCWEYAQKIIQTEYPKILRSRDFSDPSGSFVITVREGKISVEHLTPGTGEVVNCYSGKSAKQLYQQIAASCPALQVEHAMYLGTELQKAEIALSSSQSLVYIQDRPLKIK